MSSPWDSTTWAIPTPRITARISTAGM